MLPVLRGKHDNMLLKELLGGVRTMIDHGEPIT